MDVCKCVNVFQGCGEIDLPKPEGPASKWFFIKAGCGNTSPAACLPFGAMSVSPFSGGYPTGYGDHCGNSHSRPPHFPGGKELLGFAHLQQSGTGAMGYYYNYAVVSPHYPSSPERVVPTDETACPGYYSCTLGGIKCELTSSAYTAFHRYCFALPDGEVRVDFSNNGLIIPGEERKGVENLCVFAVSDDTVAAEAVIEGIKIYFAVRANGKITVDGSCAYVKAAACRNEVRLWVAISPKSREKALSGVSGAEDFDTVRQAAYEKWNTALSYIKIETKDEKLREIFYSNLYHSLIKPVDREGESFIYDSEGAFCADFNTLWDMYKTALPLIFMLYREMGEKIVETLLRTGEALGMMPNSFGLSDEYLLPTEQARMLGSYALITAYRYGIKVDTRRMLRCIMTDVFAENKKDFTVDGECRSHTWMLDMADACALAAEIAGETGDLETQSALKPLAAQWEKVYSSETGLLKEDSIYYEGTLYNYSFRQMVNMDRRIEIAGGKERFVELLDKFFGYGQDAVIQPTDPFNYAPVKEGMLLGRFEGFNNESDTEAAYSYIYAGRHDRTCEIVRAGMKYMFTTGRGGLPGNNDSGALSSYYVFAALGLFPVAGQDLFLIGSPFVDSAEVRLSSGNTLKIKINGAADDNIYVSEVLFNSVRISDYRISAKELMGGGKLEFFMSNEKNN